MYREMTYGTQRVGEGNKTYWRDISTNKFLYVASLLSPARIIQLSEDVFKLKTTAPCATLAIRSAQAVRAIGCVDTIRMKLWPPKLMTCNRMSRRYDIRI